MRSACQSEFGGFRLDCMHSITRNMLNLQQKLVCVAAKHTVLSYSKKCQHHPLIPGLRVPDRATLRRPTCNPNSKSCEQHMQWPNMTFEVLCQLTLARHQTPLHSSTPKRTLMHSNNILCCDARHVTPSSASAHKNIPLPAKLTKLMER